jgi:hypothetical protein
LVKFLVLKREVAGVVRPPYASDRIWDRLLPAAGVTRTGMQMRTIICFFPAGSVHVRLLARAPREEDVQPDLNMVPESNVILIRDSHGMPVLTNWGDGCLGQFGWCEAAMSRSRPGDGRSKSQYHSLDTFSVYKAYDGEDLSLSYHLVPGERYTLLAAVGVNHNHSGDFVPCEWLLVAPPVTFVAPTENVISRGAPIGKFLLPWGGSRGLGPEEQSALETAPAPRPALSAERQWELSSRFAGMPFHGLILEASASTYDKLFVTLRTCTKQWALIKKWSEGSDYEILVRDSQGRSVQLTDKGKRFFQGGRTLDGYQLAEGDAIKAILPIRDLFEMHAPGEYTVLASLPVIGDTIDAVLTAAPVKIRIDTPKAEPQPKK